MANKNFSDFDLRTAILSSDYIVGYKNEGPVEIRMVLNDLFNGNIFSQVSLNQSTSVGLNDTAVNSSYVYGNNSFGCNSSIVSGDNAVAFGTGTTNASYAFARGFNTLASGNYSEAGGYETQANFDISTALGYKSKAMHQLSYVWSDGQLGSLVNGISSTRDGQYRIDASGGVYFTANVSINTDNQSNALTVDGNLSASSIDVTGSLDAEYITASNTLNTNTLNVNGQTTSNIVVCEFLDATSDVVKAPTTLSAYNIDITNLTATSSVPVQGPKNITNLFLSITVGTSSLYIPLYKD